MYMKLEDIGSASVEGIKAAVQHAGYAIPPAWPLATSVAVNPFLGQRDDTLALAGSRLERIAGMAVTMPRNWYLAKVASGEITRADLLQALAAAESADRPGNIDELLAVARRPQPSVRALETIAELAADASGINWKDIIAERITAWAGSYFDEGQALWPGTRGKTPYSAWCEFAVHDLTPEIAGLPQFSAFVQQMPQKPFDAIELAVRQLGLNDAELSSYFHQLLFSLAGWSQYGRYKLWQADLEGGSDSIMEDLLAIRLVWELALLRQYSAKIAARWDVIRSQHRAIVSPRPDLVVDVVLQEAAERAKQREVIGKLHMPRPLVVDVRPRLQAVFCIDVRSEIFRRNLEAVAAGIETKGFAGFFGLAAEHSGLASDFADRRLPVLLNPSMRTCTAVSREADSHTRFGARAKRAWGRFKVAAVSSFAFVEASGLAYGLGLLGSSLRLHKAASTQADKPQFADAIAREKKVDMAESILKAMSLTENFASVVLFAGHGASVVNNPHESALQCGACGGHSGEVNARLLAGLLNEPEVRSGLAGRGISVPDDTVFVGALHDTTTDGVMLFDADIAGASHARNLQQVRVWLAAAAKLSRSERALHLPHADGANSLFRRARDWAEIRAEWGLAGCSSFVAAPRSRTAAAAFHGQAFLHDYDWQKDGEFKILELILTAPVVVASWISLQYYGSTVAPQVFGAGNKLLHNVIGGIGVVEGNGGPLRAGLPWQSVHDGVRHVHEPLRLSVYIEAPKEAIGDILAKHPEVRKLFDNKWLHLIALDYQNGAAWRYAGNLEWRHEVPSQTHIGMAETG